MSGMIQIGDVWHPLANVERLAETRGSRGEGATYYVRLRGETVSNTVSRFDFQHVLTSPLQLIPAQPETFLIWAWLDGDDGRVNRRAVIAWALCRDGRTRPVTPWGINDGDADPEARIYVEMPDGSVQATDSYEEPGSYDNVEAFRCGEAELLRTKAAGDGA